MNFKLIEKYLPNKPMAILLRHAERFSIAKADDVTKAQLTETGHKDSFDLGKKFRPLGDVKFFSSPVHRCQQTAEGISKGMNTNGNSIAIDNVYNLGGSYIIGEWNDIFEILMARGSDGYLRKWFDGDLPEDLVMPIEEFAKLELNILIEQLKSNKSSSINVTHDWNIMIMREYYLGLRHEDIGFPDFLDGMLAYIKDNNIYLHYHEYSRAIELDIF